MADQCVPKKVPSERDCGPRSKGCLDEGFSVGVTARVVVARGHEDLRDTRACRWCCRCGYTEKHASTTFPLDNADHKSSIGDMMAFGKHLWRSSCPTAASQKHQEERCAQRRSEDPNRQLHGHERRAGGRIGQEKQKPSQERR